MREPGDFSPQWAAAPGMTVGHALAEKGMSTDQLARLLNRSTGFVANLLVGREHITVEIAEALSRTIGSTPRFWLAREREYRDSLKRLAAENEDLERWASNFPLSDMRRLGWIQNTRGSELVIECLQFFGVSSAERWRAKYESLQAPASFRKSTAYETDSAALSVWLRQGEIEALQISCAEWSPAKFRACLPRARALTRIKSPMRFLPELQSMCANAGVAVVVTAAPKGCRASGAARFMSNRHALIQLSQRYRTDDQFWFTFFHEASHLLLHSPGRSFVDDPETVSNQEEQEANALAAELLLTEQQRAALLTLPRTYRAVIRFARQTGISPGIVVGQLQHAGRLNFKQLHKLKRTLDWHSTGPA